MDFLIYICKLTFQLPDDRCTMELIPFFLATKNAILQFLMYIKIHAPSVSELAFLPIRPVPQLIIATQLYMDNLIENAH